MSNPKILTINDRTGTGSVFGMHEGNGPVQWKRLATGGNLDGRIQGWDYARLPAGSLIGFHEHLNSDEVWIILQGTGDFVMEGVPRPLGPGDVMRTPIGGSHSMLNPENAESDVEFLVITLAARRPAEQASSDVQAAKSEVWSLNDGPVQFVDGDGNGFAIQRSVIDPGETKNLGGLEHQCLAFTTDGDVGMEWADHSRVLSEGSSLAIPSGQNVELTSPASESCQILEIELTSA